MSDPRPEKNGNGNKKNGRPPGAGGSNGGMRFGRGVFGWVLFIGLAVMLFMFLQNKSRNYTTIDLSQFWTELDNGKVKELTIEADEVYGQFKSNLVVANGEIQYFRATLVQNNGMDWIFVRDVLEKAKAGGTAVKAENNQNVLINIIVPLIPWLLIFGFIWFFVFRQLRHPVLAATSGSVALRPRLATGLPFSKHWWLR